MINVVEGGEGDKGRKMTVKGKDGGGDYGDGDEGG